MRVSSNQLALMIITPFSRSCQFDRLGTSPQLREPIRFAVWLRIQAISLRKFFSLFFLVRFARLVRCNDILSLIALYSGWPLEDALETLRNSGSASAGSGQGSQSSFILGRRWL
jgi:hypothetical protein